MVVAYLCGGYIPTDLFGSVFTSIKACTGPTDTKFVVAYDTRTPEFKPESMNHIAGSFGLWAHHLHWLLLDRYCERPTGMDDVGKVRGGEAVATYYLPIELTNFCSSQARLQINPGNWTTEGGGEYLWANLTRSMAKPPKGAVKGETSNGAGGMGKQNCHQQILGYGRS